MKNPIKSVERYIGGALKREEARKMLKMSYKPNKKIKDVGDFDFDKKLSTKKTKVFNNPDTGETVVVHRGTKEKADFGTDLGLVFGVENKKRLKESKKVQKKASKKYDGVDYTLGHSLGGHYAEKLGKGEGQVITLNKPVLIQDLGKKNPKNQTDIRTTLDPVSLLRPLQPGGDVVTIESKTINPFKEHTVNVLKRLEPEKMIGKGLVRRKLRPSKLRVKELKDLIKDYNKLVKKDKRFLITGKNKDELVEMVGKILFELDLIDYIQY